MTVLTVVACFFSWWSKDNFFFWDTVQLASKHAHFFYENGFESIILPTEIDSGHPPTFGAYIAFCWTVFGRTLPVSHFAILPFYIGTLWISYQIGIYYLGEFGIAFPILCFLDPTLSAQSMLVSPDILVIFFFLVCWYSIVYKKEKLLAAAVMALGLLSMRGMMIAFALFIFTLLQKEEKLSNLTNVKTKLRPFIPGGALGLGFLIAHYSYTGWIGYHPDSPWAESFATVSFSGFLKNILILIWRYIDFGRLFIYGSLWMILYRIRHYAKPKVWEAMTMVAILELILIPSLLIHQGLLGHRYLLPIFLGINLLFCICLLEFQSLKRKYMWLSIAGFFLVTGNLWIYPKKIAQGWDSSLAHTSFYELRNEMVDYIDSEEIDYQSIGTVFPQIGPFEAYDLNGRKDGFISKDFEQNEFIFYSNVMNDFSDEEIDELENSWEVKKLIKRNGIEVILYKK